MCELLWSWLFQDYTIFNIKVIGNFSVKLDITVKVMINYKVNVNIKITFNDVMKLEILCIHYSDPSGLFFSIYQLDVRSWIKSGALSNAWMNVISFHIPIIISLFQLM